MKWSGMHLVNVAVIVILAGGAAACIRYVMATDSHHAKKLYIRGGASHVDDQKLARIARPYLTKSFFNIDTAALRRRLDNLAWLHDVSVTRRWPNGVLIKLSEYEPVARWNRNALLAARGDLFRPVHRPQSTELPVLKGKPGSHEQVYTMYQRLQAIARRHDRRLKQLRYNTRGAWSARLSDGLRLRLGRHDTAARMRRFVDFDGASNHVRQRVAQAAYVDLRYPDGFAVGGARGSTTLNARKEQNG